MALPLWSDAASLDEYLAGGGDINAPDPESGWTLLHCAAENADVRLMEALVARGADLAAKDTQGWTPLHRAVDYDIDGALQNDQLPTFEGAQTTIRLGAPLDARDSEGRTPRDAAALYGMDAVRLFDQMLRDLGG